MPPGAFNFCTSTSRENRRNSNTSFAMKFWRRKLMMFFASNKCVIVGLKQENILKLRQCIEQSEEAAIYLVCEETISTTAEVAEEPDVRDLPTTSQDTSKHNKQVPPIKKAKTSRQPTLAKLFLLKISSCPFASTTLFSCDSKKNRDI